MGKREIRPENRFREAVIEGTPQIPRFNEWGEASTCNIEKQVKQKIVRSSGGLRENRMVIASAKAVEYAPEEPEEPKPVERMMRAEQFNLKALIEEASMGDLSILDEARNHSKTTLTITEEAHNGPDEYDPSRPQLPRGLHYISCVGDNPAQGQEYDGLYLEKIFASPDQVVCRTCTSRRRCNQHKKPKLISASVYACEAHGTKLWVSAHANDPNDQKGTWQVQFDNGYGLMEECKKTCDVRAFVQTIRPIQEDGLSVRLPNGGFKQKSRRNLCFTLAEKFAAAFEQYRIDKEAEEDRLEAVINKNKGSFGKLYPISVEGEHRTQMRVNPRLAYDEIRHFLQIKFRSERKQEAVEKNGNQVDTDQCSADAAKKVREQSDITATQVAELLTPSANSFPQQYGKENGSHLYTPSEAQSTVNDVALQMTTAPPPSSQNDYTQYVSNSSVETELYDEAVVEASQQELSEESSKKRKRSITDEGEEDGVPKKKTTNVDNVANSAELI